MVNQIIKLHQDNLTSKNATFQNNLYDKPALKSVFHNEDKLSFSDYKNYCAAIIKYTTNFSHKNIWINEESYLLQYSFEFQNSKIDIIETIHINKENKITRIEILARLPNLIQKFRDTMIKFNS